MRRSKIPSHVLALCGTASHLVASNRVFLPQENQNPTKTPIKTQTKTQLELLLPKSKPKANPKPKPYSLKITQGRKSCEIKLKSQKPKLKTKIVQRQRLL